jgi:glycosyltransferase involved in cell wall biosynthesis
VYFERVHSPTDALSVELESPLPARLHDGTTTALFCSGSASVAGEPVRSLQIVVDGVAHQMHSVAMPRFDLPVRRSGFWGVLPLTARAPALTLVARARSGPGRLLEAPLARIEVGGGPAQGQPIGPRAPLCSPETIVVCLATHEPPRHLLRAQLQSLREQSDQRWICVISDDASSDGAYRALSEAVGGDPRFHLSRSPERIGFYRNFERALRMAPPEARLIALCDQDDVWHPDKLITLREGLGDAQLIYSDQRLVDEHGRVLRETLWRGRANNSTNLTSMLIANTVTGAASLMRAEVARRALPFPDSPGIEFHDHWLALVALSRGPLAYVERPLYDYVQHRGAILGKVAGGAGGERAHPRWRMREWRAAYFLGYVPGQVRAATLLARLDGELPAEKARALRRYLAAERSWPALLALLARSARILAGRSETLGAEWELARGLLWRRAAVALARLPGIPDRLLLDCRFPDPPTWRQRRLERWRARI